VVLGERIISTMSSIEEFLNAKDDTLSPTELAAAAGILRAQGISTLLQLTEKLRDGNFSLERLESDLMDAQFSVAQARLAVSEVGKVWDKENDARKSHFEFVSVSVKNPITADETRVSTQEFDVQPSTKVSRFSADKIPTVTDTGDYETFATPWTIFFVTGFISTFAFTTVVGSVGFTVYTLRYGMSAIWLAQVSIICNTISTFLTLGLSYASDQYKSQYGRRKPFIFAGVIISATSFLVLAFPSPSVLNSQYLIGQLLITFGQAFVQTAIAAWIQESCKDQADQLKLTTYMAVFAQVFGVISALMALVFGANAVVIFLVLYIIFCGLFTYLMLYYVPNPVLTIVPPPPPIVPSLRSCIRTKEFQLVLAAWVLLTVLGSTMGTCFLVTIYACFGLEKVSSSQPMLLVYAVSLIVFAPVGFVVANYAISSMEKLDVYHISMVGSGIFVLILAFLLVPGAAYLDPAAEGDISKSDLFIIGLAFCFGLSLHIGMVLPSLQSLNLLVRDLIQFDYFLNDVDREAMYLTSINLPSGIVGTFVAQLLIGITYSAVFKDNGADINDDRLSEKYTFNMSASILIFFFYIFAALCSFLAAYVLQGYPLTTGVADQINDVVKKRKIKKAAALAEEQLVTDISRKSSYEEVVERMDNKGKQIGTSGVDPAMYGGKKKVDKDLLNDVDNVDTFRIGSVMKIDDSTRSSIEQSSLSNRDGLKEDEIVDFDTMVFWNFLSRNEVHTIANSSASHSDSTLNAGLAKIKLQNRLALYLFTPATIGVLVAAVVIQFQYDESFSTPLLALFQILVIYGYYEAGRYWVLTRLSTLKLKDLYTYARKADETNNKYTDTLTDMLKRNAITEALKEFDEDTNMDHAGDAIEDGYRASMQDKDISAKSKAPALNTLRSVMLGASTKGPRLVDEDPNEIAEVTDLTLPGYKRLYSFLGLIIILSSLAIMQPLLLK
jgi:Na+/melibiose symporter-like transporter